MKLKTRRLDDGFILIEKIVSQGAIVMTGLWRRSDRLGTYYESDTYCHNFRTITEWKKYLLENHA